MSGYNNPAFCNQFDTSFFDYEYVPEIDPDSPDLQRRGPYCHPRQMAPPWAFQEPILNNSNNSSDDSGSIIIEERNNRRVTLICEKRPKVIMDKDGGYIHDISLESNDSEPEVETIDSCRGFKDPQPGYQYDVPPVPPRRPATTQNYLNPEEFTKENSPRPVVERGPRASRHRYEDIPPPSYEEDMLSRQQYETINEQLEIEGVHFLQRKGRAPSPPTVYYESSTPYSTENLQWSSKSSAADVVGGYRESATSPNTDAVVFELPQISLQRHRSQREPPVGASASHAPESQSTTRKFNNNDSILNMAERGLEPSVTNHEIRRILTPKNSAKIVRASSRKIKSVEKDVPKHSVRRNISSSFICEPTGSSPYRPKTQRNARQTIITPIPHKQFAQQTSNTINIHQTSKLFKSMNNVSKGNSGNQRYQVHPQHETNHVLYNNRGQLKRNQSVPNFSENNKNTTPEKVCQEEKGVESPNGTGFRNIYYPSPQTSPYKFSLYSRSRLSLLNDATIPSCHSDEDNSKPSPPSSLTLGSIITLAAGMITCVICFYLLSKLGRRYYLDCGILAGFVSTVLGCLGFRSQCWKGVPNRNYTSGYAVLGAFSVLNAIFPILIIATRPRAGDPMIDICAGAICAVSVIVIALALTGITMSGFCKTPPPDNRVNSA